MHLPSPPPLKTLILTFQHQTQHPLTMTPQIKTFLLLLLFPLPLFFHPSSGKGEDFEDGTKLLFTYPVREGVIQMKMRKLMVVDAVQSDYDDGGHNPKHDKKPGPGGKSL